VFVVAWACRVDKPFDQAPTSLCLMLALPAGRRVARGGWHSLAASGSGWRGGLGCRADAF